MRGKASTAQIVSLTISLDLHKVFIDDESYHDGHGHAYDFYGVDPEKGAVAIVRPDNCEYPLTRFCHLLMQDRCLNGS